MFSFQPEIVKRYAADPLYNVEMTEPSLIYEEGNEVCSDYMKVFLKVGSKEIAEEITYIGPVMNYHLASASLIIDDIKGKHINTILDYKLNYLIGLGLEVKKSKYKNILFPLKAIRNAVHTYLEDGKQDEIVDLLE